MVKKKGEPTGQIGGLEIDDPEYAERFIRRALWVAGKRGTVAMLLRMNYIVPAARHHLRDEFGLPDMYALEKRPSYNGSGTDATDYAWFVWGPKRGGRYFVL